MDTKDKQETGTGILTIEESFDRLDSILEKMEDEKTGLEETFRLYEEGIKLVKNVSSSIDKVEKKIRILEEEAASAKDGYGL